MTESINDIAIKLSVHAEGVTAGFRTAAEEARGFQKEIERFSYAVDKGLNDRKFGPLLDAALTSKAVDERLAREKQSQEEFNAWYRAESEKEYQAWYAIELKKEQVREQQLADDRQRAINTSNAQNFQRQLPAETTARADENANLQRAIMDRYALLDKEQRQAQLYAGNLVGIEKMKAERLQQVADQLEAQREADFAAYKAQLAQEEVAGAAAAAKQSRLERARQLDAKRAADDARRQALNDMRADMAERERLMQDANAKQGTKGIIQQIRAQQRAAAEDREEAIHVSNRAQAEANAIIQRTLTLNQRYAQQLATLVRLNKTVLVTTGSQALSDQQLATAKTALTLATIRQQQAQLGANAAMAGSVGGYGGVAMAMGQMSYAAEDFIQVLAMGGGLNMALMSASNNLSMVARALMGTGVVMSAVAGLAIPAVLIGTSLLIQYLSREEEQIDAVTRAYKRLHDELEHTQELLSQQMQHRFNMQDIDDLTTYAAALAKLRQEIRAMAEAEAEAAALEAKIAATRKEIRDTVAGGTIIADAQKSLDMMRQMRGVHDAAQIAAAANDVRQLTEAYTELADAMATGTPDEIVRAAEEMKRVIDGTSEVFKLEFLTGSQASKLAAILGTDDEIVKLEALRELMQELALINGDMANGADAIEKTQENMNRLLRQETQLRQDNIRFQLEATDAQKEAADIQNQLAQFLGVDNPNPMQGLDPNDMSAEQARQSAEFLELMWRNLDRQKKEILEEKQRVTPVGGLEQNTYQAQADAFRQVLEATNREEDPQLTRLIRLQEAANDLLEGTTGIRIEQ